MSLLGEDDDDDVDVLEEEEEAAAAAATAAVAMMQGKAERLISPSHNGPDVQPRARAVSKPRDHSILIGVTAAI